MLLKSWTFVITNYNGSLPNSQPNVATEKKRIIRNSLDHAQFA